MASSKNKKIDFNYKRDKGLTGKILFLLYSINKPMIRRTVIRMMYHLLGKNFQFYSITIRRIFKVYHNVEVGMYSHGGCFIPGIMPPGTRIGRYCSIALTATVHDANHPMNTKSTNGLFFNPALGYAQNEIVSHTNLVIENDVWIGHNAIILPSCAVISTGAVIGAGVVVNKNIPPYAVTVGNPGRIIRSRFDDETIKQLLESKWWVKSIEELLPEFNSFQTPIGSDVIR